MLPFAKAALQKPVRRDGLLFARTILADRAQNENERRRHGTELRRLGYLARRGLWLDLVANEDSASTSAEPSNRGPRRPRKSPEKKSEWKPLPDALTHAAGWRAAWITEHLAPVVLNVFEKAIAAREGWGVDECYRPANRLISFYSWSLPDNQSAPPFEIIGMSWPPKNSEELLVWLKLVQQAHGFITGLSTGPRASEILSWNTDCLVEGSDGMTLATGRTFKIVAPVDGAPTVWPLPKLAVLAVSQQVRLSLLLSDLAEKIEEEEKKPSMHTKIRWEPIARALKERGLSHSCRGPGYVRSAQSNSARTTGDGPAFCGVGRHRLIRWKKTSMALFPTVVMVASKLNLALEDVLVEPEAVAYAKWLASPSPKPARKEAQPLWRVFGGKGKGNALTGTYNDDLRDFIATLGLLHLCDDQKLVYHRFRKTLARIVALCYAHAPQILMDIFGHQDIDMTLHYILADPGILEDINAIQREIRLMRATDLILNVDACGGAGAKRLKAAVSQFKMGKEDFGTDDAYEAAVMWTLDGRTWDYMGHGRFCLKGPFDRAPCAKGHSIANKAKCNKDCEHRLCSPEGKRDSDEAIGSAVTFLEQAWASDDYMMATQWSGQILAKIDDYEQLHEKWKSHPVVARVLVEAGRNEKVTA
jgi:hypothetical protein